MCSFRITIVGQHVAILTGFTNTQTVGTVYVSALQRSTYHDILSLPAPGTAEDVQTPASAEENQTPQKRTGILASNLVFSLVACAGEVVIERM